MREQVLREIENILCEYYEAATDGHICDEEAQKMMGNKDWADTILYRVFNELFPKKTEGREFWDYDRNTSFTQTVDTRPSWVIELLGENDNE